MRPEHWRPDHTGQQRTGEYLFILWRDRHGVVHEANLYSNQALCEMWLANPALLVLEIEAVADPGSVVTCVACVAWSARQARCDGHLALRRERLAESLRLARGALAPRLALLPRDEGSPGCPRDEGSPGDQLHQPLGGQHARP